MASNLKTNTICEATDSVTFRDKCTWSIIEKRQEKFALRNDKDFSVTIGLHALWFSAFQICLLLMSHTIFCQLVQTVVSAARLISLCLCMNYCSGELMAFHVLTAWRSTGGVIKGIIPHAFVKKIWMESKVLCDSNRSQHFSLFPKLTSKALWNISLIINY